MKQNMELIKLYEEMMELKIKHGLYKEFPSYYDYCNEHKRAMGWKKIKQIFFRVKEPTFDEYEILKALYDGYHKSPGINITETGYGGFILSRRSDEEYINYYKDEIKRIKQKFEK